MTTITLPRIPSGMGDIHQLESQHYDIVLKFTGGNNFVIGAASYYGGGWSYAKTLDGAKRAAERFGLDYNPTIIERDGSMYDCYGGYMGNYNNDCGC